MKKIILSIILCICILSYFPSFFVDAASPKYKLNETNLNAYPGNEFYLSLIDVATGYNLSDWGYSACTFYSSNEKVATVSEWGKVTVVGTGKATISASKDGTICKCTITSTPNPYHLKSSSITAKTNVPLTLSLSSTKNVTGCFCEAYLVDGDILREAPYNSLDVTYDRKTKKIILEATKPGKYHVDLSVRTESGKDDAYSYIYNKSSYTVEVLPHGFTDKAIGCALDVKRQLTYGDLTNVTFTVDDPTIATVSETGLITPKAVGKTTIWMEGMGPKNQIEFCECSLDVAEPKVTLKKTFPKKSYRVEFDISNVSYSMDDILYRSSNESIIATNDHYPMALKEGKCTLTVTVYGKEFSFPLEVIDPRLNIDASTLLTKGSSFQVEVQGLGSLSSSLKPTYSIYNTSIATVSKSGKITTKSAGSTTLYVRIGTEKFKTILNVGTKQAVAAIANATDAVGSLYSQEKRMQKGYYDCSSLIWRSYSPAKVMFGSNTYAPPSASLAKYLADHKQLLPVKDYKPSELKPGDLIFFMGEPNNRYKNIYHVALYTGLSYVDSYSSVGAMIHAKHGSIQHDEIEFINKSHYLVGRPTK